MGGGGPPLDWYRSSFSPSFDSYYWEQGGEEKARLAVRILALEGGERILDLACATGRRTLELCRLGFKVVGVDVQGLLLQVAGGEADLEGLWPYFYETDTRELKFTKGFDVVLSLGGGAFEHFGDDEENLRAFEAAARSLKPRGRLLMQIPNLLRVEASSFDALTIREGEAVETIEQEWDPVERMLVGERTTIIDADGLEEATSASFARRVYSIEELAKIFEQIGLLLVDVFDEGGERCVPSREQLELFVEARVAE